MIKKVDYPFYFQSELNKKFNIVFDFFLPRLCPCCNKKLNFNETIICIKCFFELEKTNEYLIKSEYQNKFQECGLIDEFKAAFVFRQESPVQFLLHSLKYDKRFLVGIFLGRLLAKFFLDEIKSWNADFIIPVPLHRLKKAERSFNQSEYIAKGISRETNVKIKTKLLKRKRFTETQTHLSQIERMQNVKNAFEVKNALSIKGKKIILVDDVVTTGSTINECAKVVKDAGAEKIYGLFVATVPH
ncbi:MAG: ComF family protein [Ignavibacterium sp.]|nr:ComF family protein [Ignavibacterium sp.]MDW8375476.1 ComF family protein [Ignavibacteriales bacterium]